MGFAVLSVVTFFAEGAKSLPHLKVLFGTENSSSRKLGIFFNKTHEQSGFTGEKLVAVMSPKEYLQVGTFLGHEFLVRSDDFGFAASIWVEEPHDATKKAGHSH